MSGPFRDREHMLNCLLDAEIQAYRRPGMTVGDLAPLLSTDELRSLYYDRKIREYAKANGMDPDATPAPTCSPPAGPATASENGMNRPTYTDGPAGGDDRRGTA